MDGLMDGLKDDLMDGLMDDLMDGLMDGLKDDLMDGSMDDLMDDLMDGLMDGQRFPDILVAMVSERGRHCTRVEMRNPNEVEWGRFSVAASQQVAVKG